MTSPAYVPFGFAWVTEDQTTFDPETMFVYDVQILSIDLKHDEGQVPTLDIVIKNPRVGLLGAGRYQWAWLSYQPTAAEVDTLNAIYSTSPSVYDGPLAGMLPLTYPCVVPLCFCVLIGIPTDLFAETVTLKFLARSPEYIALKQACAETLKVSPNYDPIFLDETHRDEPDAILEGWSAMYHVDRLTQAVTASDVLEGEDGTVTFLQQDAIYDSVGLTLGEAPLTNIEMQATVHWTQRSEGYVPGPDVNVQSYTGGSWLTDWPKPGSGLGGGWTVETSYIEDVFKVDLTPNWSLNTSQTFYGETVDYDCATVSTSASISSPALLTPSSLAGNIVLFYEVGICDPGSIPPTNTPSSVRGSGVIVPLWTLNATWTLRYNAKREYTELLTFNVKTNTQSILASPTVEQDTKLIKVSGEVGQPLIEYAAWTDFIVNGVGRSVGVGQLIFPNNPTTPGGMSYQVCVAAGVVGSDPNAEPDFSDTPGTLTQDNTVTWASLGESPSSAIQQMTFGTTYNIGTILLYQEQEFDMNLGGLTDIIGATSYWLVTGNPLTPGVPTATTSQYSEFTYIPAVVSSDEPTPAEASVFTELFSPSPPGEGDPVVVVGGGTLVTGPFNTPGLASGAMVSLGQQPAWLGIPIGGTANNVTANNYFPTDRGQQSIEYLINKARAQLRWRARAVKIKFDVPFALAIGLSCRLNATLYDSRLPGGAATGKVISYGLSAKDGHMLGHVEIGCSVGYGASIPQITGTPTYATTPGYVQDGYQQYDGAQYTLGEEDIGYTPPAYAPFDDGLIFPLTYLPSDGGVFSGTSGAPSTPGQTVISVHNPGDMAGSGPPPILNTEPPPTMHGQAAAIYSGIVADLSLLAFSTPPTPVIPVEAGVGGATSVTTGLDANQAWSIANAFFADTMENLPWVMEANPISWECLIQPVTNGPFLGLYSLTLTPLEVPQGIDLSAPSSP